MQRPPKNSHKDENGKRIVPQSAYIVLSPEVGLPPLFGDEGCIGYAPIFLSKKKAIAYQRAIQEISVLPAPVRNMNTFLSDARLFIARSIRGYGRPGKKLRKWTPREYQLVKRLYEDGKTLEDIAEAVGRTPSGIYAQLYKHNDLKDGQRVPRRGKNAKLWSARDFEKAKEMRREGKSWEEIGALLGKSPKAVYLKFYFADEETVLAASK